MAYKSLTCFFKDCWRLRYGSGILSPLNWKELRRATTSFSPECGLGSTSSLPSSCLSGVVWPSDFLWLQMLDFLRFSYGSSKVHGGTINIVKHTWEFSPQTSLLGGYRHTSLFLITKCAERGPDNLWSQKKLLQADLFPLSASRVYSLWEKLSDHSTSWNMSQTGLFGQSQHHVW